MTDVLSAASSIGTRARQEDQYRHGGVPHGWYLIVCDGLGGRPDGGECARLAADAAQDYLVRVQRGPRRKKFAQTLMDLPGQVQMTLEEAAIAGSISRDAATTLSVALVVDDLAWLMSIGDSRCSVVRAGQIQETTTPHNLLAQAVRDGSSLLAEGHREGYLASSITRSIGPTRCSDFDARERAALLIVPVRRGDTVVVTSDGVHESLGLQALTRILAQHAGGGSTLADELVMRAVAHAGADADNATAVVLQLDADIS